jgi:hypothetical protein
MWRRSTDDSGRWRVSSRFAFLLLIPAGLIVYLLYAAQSAQEARHARNLRWLAQMATQITNRVQVQADFVRDRSERPAGLAAASEAAETLPQGPVANAAYSIETLRPVICDKERKNLTVVDEGVERWLYLRHTGRSETCARSDLKKLVEPAIRKGAFTSVILAQRNGRVLYESGPESLRITDVSFLFARTAAERTKPAKENDGGAEAPASSVYFTRAIGDDNFEIFVQPLPLRAEARTSDADWILVGIAEKRHLLRSSSPSSLLVVLPLVLLLLAMGWPLQRLWSMSPFDAFRPAHVVAAVLCSMGIVTILSLLVVNEYSRHASMARSDAQLRRFAGALGRNVAVELKLAVDQLRRLDAIAVAKDRESHTNVLTGLLAPADVRLPFHYADWADEKGDKIIRWTTRTAPAQLVNVSDRTYFQDALTGNGLLLPGIADERIAIQHVLSRTSGESATMIGIPSNLRVRDIRVASIALTLASLSEPVVPRDLGFAIMDPSGAVLFHSDKSRIFVENLFEESLQSDQLRGVVERRIPAFLDLDYDATPHRLFVTPLPGVERLPWTLVVFRRLAGNRVGRMQILVDSMALLGLYVAGLALCIGLALFLTRRTLKLRYPALRQWWSRIDDSRLYVAGSGLAVMIALWRAFDRARETDLLYAVIASALTFLLVTSAGLREPGAGGSSRTARVAGALLRLVTVPTLLAAFLWTLGDTPMMLVAPGLVVAWGLLQRPILRALERGRRRALLKTAWLAWGVQLAVALCIAPALCLYKISIEYELGLRLRDSQLWLSNAALKKRALVARSIDELTGFGLHADLRARLLAAWERPSPDAGRPLPPLYYYGADTSNISLASITGSQEDVCKADSSKSPRPEIGLVSALSRAVLSMIELRSDERLFGGDARRRGLEPADNLWTWRQLGRNLCLYSDTGAVQGVAPLPVFDPFQIRGAVVQAAETGRPERRRGPIISAAPVWFALAGILLVVAAWMDRLRRRLLCERSDGDEAGIDPVLDAGAAPPRRLMLISNAGCHRRLPANLASYLSIDLSREEFRLDAKTRANLPPEGLLLDRFEANLHDPAVRKSRLELLQAASCIEETPIAICSEIDCLRYLAAGGSGDPAAAAPEAELRQWLAFTSRFDRRVLPLDSAESVDGAAVWESCSEQEQAVMLHLSRYGVPNPCASRIVQGLLRRGLLRRTADRAIDFARPELARFVADAEMLGRQTESPRLGRSRLPAYAIGLLLLGFVILFSQEELTTRLIGFITTLTGGFEAVRKQLAGLRDLASDKKS